MVDHRLHMRLVVLEEVIRPLDLLVRDGDSLLLAQLADQGVGVLRRRHAVGGAVDDQARGGAGGKEAEIIHVRRRRDRDEAGDLGPAHQKLHADPGAEAEARDPAMLRVRVHRLQIVECRGSIRQLADALVILALRPADAAEVEAQHGEADLVEGVMQVVDDAIVHRAAEFRIGVKNDRDRRVRDGLRVVAALEATFGTGENDFGHRLSPAQSRASRGGAAVRVLDAFARTP
ncbi:hypothetical protein SDC9_39047 [bioreactor metagenome]|uniref:Uncharacterized protein n=1 Tax=bioreactor metagenome TaxID=1076179 RepID=A0A644VR67_9ZZZZ